MPTEADACRTFVVPALHAAGWGDGQIRERFFFSAWRSQRGKRRLSARGSQRRRGASALPFAESTRRAQFLER